MKPYSHSLKVWKEENSSDIAPKGRIYRTFKKALRGYWKRQLRKFEDK